MKWSWNNQKKIVHLFGRY